MIIKHGEEKQMRNLFICGLIISVVLILFGVTFITLAATGHTLEADTAVDSEEPPASETVVETVSIELEYDIPLEKIEYPAEEDINEEDTEFIEEVTSADTEEVKTNEIVVETETMPEPIYEESVVTEVEKEVDYNFSKTILIDFSDEDWAAAYNEATAQYEAEIQMIAKVMLNEAGGVPNQAHIAAVGWCILNRVDAGYGSLSAVITASGQFAWNPNTIVRDDLYWLAKDVVTRWILEKKGFINVGRVLPMDYLWFTGDGVDNNFRCQFDVFDYWNWSWASPYN